MKRLARTLSSRSSGGSKSRPHPPSSYGEASARPNQAHVRKSSLTSPIPPYTQLHFPQCPHTTPPTPRPARLPAVLRTELVDPERRMTDDSGAGRDSNSVDGGVQVRQFLTAPTHCLDCTLALAAQQESWIRERCDAVVRELKLRLVEMKSGLAALGAAENAPVSSSQGNRSELDHETKEGVQISKLDTEIQRHEECVGEHLRRRDGDVRKLWDQVRRDWEGGVREVVRDDGTGEAEERCVFVMPWDEDVSGLGEGGYGIRQGVSVRVMWLPIEEE